MQSHLSLVQNDIEPAKVDSRRRVIPGVGYPLNELSGVHGDYQAAIAALKRQGDDSGVITDYPLSSNSADIRVLPDGNGSIGEDEAVYLWDTDRVASDSFKLSQNRFELLEANLEAPVIRDQDFKPTLTMSPSFEISYETSGFVAEIAEIRLVNSERFVQLENGEKIFLVATPEAVLVDSSSGESEQEASLFQHRSGVQAMGESRDYCFTNSVSQVVPQTFRGYGVETLTVLEQYTSYFMQRAFVDKGNSIWVPVMAPISWGWSIRVAPILHNEWSIVRRKLMLPTVGHDGLQFPKWNSSFSSCRTALQI